MRMGQSIRDRSIKKARDMELVCYLGLMDLYTWASGKMICIISMGLIFIQMVRGIRGKLIKG
jgi:hypothetical protein